MKVACGASAIVLLLLIVFSSSVNGIADQISKLNELIRSRKSSNPPFSEPWDLDLHRININVNVNVNEEDNHEDAMKGDKISSLPGQPKGVDFYQYSGYITVDAKAGRQLFYYFVESPDNSSDKPLVMWLNGGPGCSSLIGAMEELGPFRVNSDGQTLFRNPYSWNNVANVLFLESPAGVGFSYSENKTDINNVGDKRTAEDSYIFLVNWLERFPQYKYRDFFITGESYAGHYVPQLAYTILSNNKHNGNHYINLNGIAIGNAWIDDLTGSKGTYDYWWTHALISNETYNKITKLCDYTTGHFSIKCEDAMNKAIEETGPIDIYSIYAPECYGLAAPGSMIGSVKEFDPCSGQYMDSYLNLPTVQAAFHARPTNWSQCGFNNGYWADAPTTVLPIIRKLMTNGISVWIYSGDTDGRVPVTSSRYAINLWKLSVRTPWRQWYAEGKDGVGGYVEEYKGGLTFVTVRGAGHIVPSYQPERALTMISAFLQGKLPS